MAEGSNSEMPPPPPVGDPQGDLTKEQRMQIEKQEEQKLRAKYPIRGMLGGGAVGKPGGPGGLASGAGGGGHSAFLQKRLAKGQKYFDFGDYQMAKQKTRGGLVGGPGRLAMPVLAQPPTGETIPTPESVPARKTSIIQPLHDHTLSMHLPSDPAHVSSPEHGKPIPNPAVTNLTS